MKKQMDFRPVPPMSHEEMAQRVLDRVPPKLLLRIIPKPCMTGQFGPEHRHYVCFADYEELQGLPLREVVKRIYNGFDNEIENLVAAHPNAPFYDTKSYLFEEYGSIPPSCNAMEETEFFVLAVQPAAELDCVPATWKAMALIITDDERYPNAHITNSYLERFKGFRPFKTSDFTHGLDYYGFDNFVDERAVIASQGDAYNYLRETDWSFDEIIDSFGVHAWCWHGCGYIGPGFHILSRVFFGKNLAIGHLLVQSCQLMSIEDTLPIQI